MQYMLLIDHGTTPTPYGATTWKALSEDERNALYADYRTQQRLDDPAAGALGVRTTQSAHRARPKLFDSGQCHLPGSGRHRAATQAAIIPTTLLSTSGRLVSHMGS